MKIAIIGSGISGLSAAFYLSKKHNVDLFEREDHFGGHAHTIDLKIDPGVQTGSLFRIRGEGVPMLNRKGRGDLLVEIVVSTPKKLNKDAKELFKQLAEHLDIPLDSKEG